MKYFIDCGTHLFQGLQTFDKKYNFDDSWKVYSFEANPITYETAKKNIPQSIARLNLVHENKAVSDCDGTVTINCDMNNDAGMGQGSNILEEPPSTDIVYGGIFSWIKKEVVSFNLSNFINSLNDADKIIIKLDIEGAEFRVLESLLNKQTFKKINKMYIEFHERFFINELEKYKSLKKYYIEEFRKNGVDIEEWM